MRVECDKDALFRFLTRRFKNSEISLFGEGWTSIAFAVDNRVLRFPKNEDVIKRYQREIRILDLLRPMTDTPIPRPGIVLDDLYPYVIHEIVPGHYWSFKSFQEMPESMQRALARDCAAFLYQIHSVDLARAKPIIAETKIGPTPSEPVPREKLLNLIGNRLPRAVFDNIYDKYLDLRQMPSNGDYCVLHLDFKGTNSILDDSGRLAGVFDFVNTNIKERTQEFRYFYNPNCPAFLSQILDAYEDVSGIRIDINRIKALGLCSNIDGMRNMSPARLGDIFPSALDSRIERMCRFA